MSRIGKLVIGIPEKVEVKITNQRIEVSGPQGSLAREISNEISITKIENQIRLTPKDESRKARELHGLSRSLVNNMVLGVSTKFERHLEIKGVGYRAQVKNKELLLNLGYSHQVILSIPSSLEVKVEANTNVFIQGINKEEVGQFAATLRSKRPPEPYKGKGVLYKGEIIKRKVGKSGK